MRKSCRAIMQVCTPKSHFYLHFSSLKSHLVVAQNAQHTKRILHMTMVETLRHYKTAAIEKNGGNETNTRHETNNGPDESHQRTSNK